MENGLDIVSYKIGKEHGGVQPTGEIDITQNGITNVSGYATANVQVPEKQLEEKSVTISSNTTTLIEPSTGKDGMSSVSVTTNIPEPSGKITITQNGTDIDVSSYASADVNVPAGADLSDYFNSTGTAINGSPYLWGSLIKKIPPITITGDSLRSAFKYYKGTELPQISDLSSITNFSEAFENCTNLTNVDFSNMSFSTSIYNFQSVFQYCTNLENVDLSTLGTTPSNLGLSSVFYGCTKLKKVNLSNFAPRGYNTTTNMFSGCTSLEELDISSMNFSNIGVYTSNMFTGVPDNCLILVKDQTAKDWFTTNWSNLTNVQIKSEYIANQGA